MENNQLNLIRLLKKYHLRSVHLENINLYELIVERTNIIENYTKVLLR